MEKLMYFYCDKCSFRRERDNSLRDMESLWYTNRKYSNDDES